MSRARLALLIAGILLLVSMPTAAAAKTDVLRLARRALHIAERADKAARAKPKPIVSKNISPGGVANANLADGSVDARTLGPASTSGSDRSWLAKPTTASARWRVSSPRSAGNSVLVRRIDTSSAGFG